MNVALSQETDSQDNVGDRQTVAPAQPAPPAADASNQAGQSDSTQQAPALYTGPPAPQMTVSQWPQAPHPVPGPRQVRTPGRGLKIAGWATLGGGYLASAIIGITLGNEAEDSGQFFLPIMGSAIFGIRMIDEGYDKEYGAGERLAGLYFTIPSIIQLTGVALLIVGYTKAAKRKDQHNQPSVAVVPIGPNGRPGFSLLF